MIYKQRISITLLSGLIVEILNKIAPLIIIHVAQQRLGIEKLGYALFGISVIELLIPFIIYGYNQYGVIAAGREPSSTARLISGITVLKSIHTIVLVCGLFAFFRYVPAYQSYFSLIMTLSVLLGFATLDMLWVQAASQKVSVSNFFIGICRMITLLLILFFIKNSQDAILFALLSLTGNALVNTFSMLYSVHKFGLVTPDWKSIKQIFIASSPYSLIIILGVFAERIDIFFAEHFGGLKGAGYYACCARLGHSLTQIANTIIAAFFSEMVVLKDKESLNAHMRMSTWVLLFFISPIVFGVWFVAGDILNFIFDDSFRSIESLLGWLLLSTAFSLIASSFGQQVLLLSGQVKSYAKALAIGILISSVLAYFVGGRSLYAIAIAMCIGKFFTMLIVLYATRKTLVEFPLSILVRTIVPGMVMAFVLYCLKFESFLRNIGVGACTFLFFGYFLNRQEYRYVFTHVCAVLRLKRG